MEFSINNRWKIYITQTQTKVNIMLIENFKHKIIRMKKCPICNGAFFLYKSEVLFTSIIINALLHLKVDMLMVQFDYKIQGGIVMNPNLEIVKTFAPIATPFISSVVEVWIKPKLRELYKNNKIKNDVYENIFGEKFEDYLKRAYERNNVMNTVVFQNRPKSIEELYIPLTLQSHHTDIEDIIIDGNHENIISKIKKMVITDSAGMGKSTVLKKMFIDCIHSNFGVPIFIELRKLTKENRIIDEIFKELNPIDEEFDRNFILTLIKRGDFVFFLDGYDEIPLSERKSVTEDLQSFISKSSENLFILSSRPQTAIASFVNFHEFNIKPLEKNEAFELLRKYDEKASIAEQLIKIITEEPKSNNLEEFLTNPLMVSLLFKGYEYKNTISYKKSIFYRQVYDALFENHDLSKGGAFVHDKLSKLDIEEFHMVLRIVAFLTWKKGKIEYDKDEILKYLRKAKLHTTISFKESEFLEDLVANVPLFYKDGNLYRWKHKSLQEYFSAQYICTDTKEKQEEILNNIYFSKNFDDYLNVLDLCYDIDYKTFRKSIIYNFVCEALNYYNTSYKYIEDINTVLIEERKNLTFNKKYFIVNMDKIIDGDVDIENISAYEKGIDTINDIYKEEIKGFNVKSASYKIGSKIHIYTFEKTNYRIGNLLWHKREKFMNVMNYLNNINLDDSFLLEFKETKCTFIDDNPLFIFNQNEYFENINNYIKTEYFENYFIRFNMLREIKEEIENEKKILIDDELSVF